MARYVKYYTGYTWFLTPHWLRRFGPLKLVKTPLLDRIALHYYTLYASLNAVLTGVFTLNTVILRKALGASELEIGLISAIGPISLLLGIFGSEAVSGRPKQPFILWIGLLSRASILLFLFCKTFWVFFLIITVFDLLNALLMPPVFGFWRQNISETARSKLWGITVTLSTVISMATAYLTGVLYDIDPMSFRWVLAAAALLAMLGTTVLAFSPGRGQYKLATPKVPYSFRSLVIQPVRSFYELIRHDRWFASFEKVFMIYGFAVMMLFPLMPLYIADVAKMSYEQAGITLGVLGQIGVIVCSPIWGMLMDKLGPIRTCSIVFGLLMLYPAFLLLGMLPGLSLSGIHWFVYLGHVLFGVAMSGVSVVWSLGPMTFAGGKDPSPYAGAHVTITGLRGCVFPMVGALGVRYLGYQYVLAAALVLFAVAMFGMHRLAIRYRLSQPAPAT